MKLIVKEPFETYRRGEEITDAVKMASALAAHAGHVLKVATPEAAHGATEALQEPGASAAPQDIEPPPSHEELAHPAD